MNKIAYFVGLVAALSIIFGSIIHYFGNQYGDIVILIGSAITVLCLFFIDNLKQLKTTKNEKSIN